MHAFTLVVALKLSYGRKIYFQFGHMPTGSVKYQVEIVFDANVKKEFNVLGLINRSLNDCQVVQFHAITLVVALKLS
jgi:hypothetical protein